MTPSYKISHFKEKVWDLLHKNCPVGNTRQSFADALEDIAIEVRGFREKFRIYMGSTEIEVTKVMIEEDGWNATELLYEDLKNFRRVVSDGTGTKSHYKYLRDFLTYLINKEDYWEEEN